MPRIFIGGRPQNGSHKPEYVTLNRHALTIASSGSGKGACQILPNCLEWEGSLVVVDPKGEAAEFTVSKLPQDEHDTVAVLDPFAYADVPDHFRKRFNPLDLVRTSDDLRMVANGLVMRSANEADPFWKDSAEAVIAGILAFICERCAPADRHLGTLRKHFRNLQNADTRAAALKVMRDTIGFNGLAIDAANRLSQDGATVRSILQNVDTATVWLTSDAALAFLQGGDGLDLHQLKRGKLKLFLVLPADMLDQYGVFLRLFVRLCLSVMWQKIDGKQKDGECLFLLDEFAALGKINEIRTSALQQGRSFGLHVWPFVIGWGQLETLYGRDGAQDFLASADAVSYYGVQDDPTSELISRRLGNVTADDISKHLRRLNRKIDSKKEEDDVRRKKEEEARRWEIDQARQSGARELPGTSLSEADTRQASELRTKTRSLESLVGYPRFPAEVIRDKTAQVEHRDGVVIAQWMLLETPTFNKWLRPWPHFYSRSAMRKRYRWDGLLRRNKSKVDPLPPPPKGRIREGVELLLGIAIVVGLLVLFYNMD